MAIKARTTLASPDDDGQPNPSTTPGSDPTSALRGSANRVYPTPGGGATDQSDGGSLRPGIGDQARDGAGPGRAV